MYDISEQSYLSSIRHLAKGYYVLAEAYFNYHLSGFADWKGIFQQPDVGQNEVEKAMVNQIDDIELFNAFNDLKNQLQEIKDVDRYIVEWLAGFVGASSVKSKKDIAYLERRLRKIIVGGAEGKHQGPVWVINPEYQALLKRSGEIVNSMNETLRRLDEKIQKLIENVGEAEDINS